MWVVASIKNIDLFKKELKKKINDVKFYYPKIKSIKEKNSKNLLGNYIFCYSQSFLDERKKLISKFNFVKGLKKMLFANIGYQDEITNFIKFCEMHEDENGFIKNSFFKNSIYEKGKFLNGPLSNYIFSIIKKEKNKIKVLIGEVKVSISDKGKFNYSAL